MDGWVVGLRFGGCGEGLAVLDWTGLASLKRFPGRARKERAKPRTFAWLASFSNGRGNSL